MAAARSEMLRGRPRIGRALAAAPAFSLATGTARACSVCFGAPDDPETRGASLAIAFLLVVVAVLLASFAAFFICLARRANLVPDPVPAGAAAAGAGEPGWRSGSPGDKEQAP